MTNMLGDVRCPRWSITKKVIQKVTKRQAPPENATLQPSQDFFPRPPMPIGPANGPFYRTR